MGELEIGIGGRTGRTCWWMIWNTQEGKELLVTLKYCCVPFKCQMPMRHLSGGNKKARGALAGWLSWLERHPVHQKFVGLIPGRDTYRRQPINVCLSHQWFSFSFSLSPPPFFSL